MADESAHPDFKGCWRCLSHAILWSAVASRPRLPLWIGMCEAAELDQALVSFGDKARSPPGAAVPCSAGALFIRGPGSHRESVEWGGRSPSGDLQGPEPAIRR